MIEDTLDLSCELISRPSVTPADEDCQAVVTVNKNIILIVVPALSGVSDASDPDSNMLGVTGDHWFHISLLEIIVNSSIRWYVLDSRSGSPSITCSSIW